MTDLSLDALLFALDLRAKLGQPIRFWLRDDDAVAPTGPLETLLNLGRRFRIPLTLAVIPALGNMALVDRLSWQERVEVVAHGWSHKNHAPPDQKKAELGPHRPPEQVLAELARGYGQLLAQYGRKFVPVQVPPWNRIDPAVIAGLPALGFRALSSFGPEGFAALQMINSHVDLIDWRGTGRCKPSAALVLEFAARITSGATTCGLLTHHLVHDDAAWRFLTRLFAATSEHPGCHWLAITDLMTKPAA